jgi:hypothetical protein
MQLRIRPNRSDKKFAEAIFARYAAKEGSGHIATATSLAHLAACLRVFRPRSVLEIGAGIGTITDALLSHPSGVEHVVAIEQNDFCLRALAGNLRHHDAARFLVVSDPRQIPEQSFAMIIGDGHFAGFDVFAAARAGTIVFADGRRQEFRQECERQLRIRNLGISFTRHGAGRRLKLRYWSRIGLPVFKVAPVRKGCWIGQAAAIV